MPSALGHQPKLAIEIGEPQESITLTKEGAITLVQAVNVPAGSLADSLQFNEFLWQTLLICQREGT